MSLNMRLGKRGNLLQPGPGAYRQLLLESPILLENELQAIQTSSGLTVKVMSHLALCSCCLTTKCL
jgi:glutamate synthase (ferredoxin)